MPEVLDSQAGVASSPESSAAWPWYLGADPLATQSHLQECLHENHWTERAKIIRALARSYGRSLERHARRLADCGRAARFYIDPDFGKVKPWIARCRSRLCPFCAKARSGALAGKLRKVLAHARDPRSLVLTLKSTNRPLADELARLKDSFRKLRRVKAWKAHVTGGAYAVEVTYNPKTGQWHPHLHILIDGSYFPHAELVEAWNAATGDSYIVWIEAVRDHGRMAGELAAYCGKPEHVATWPAYKIHEYAYATRSARMFGTFGWFYKTGLADDDPGEPDSPHVYSVSLPKLVSEASEGDTLAGNFLTIAIRRWPVFAPYVLHAIPTLDYVPSAAERNAAALRRIVGSRPPPAGGGRLPNLRENLDAALFLAFVKYRQFDLHRRGIRPGDADDPARRRHDPGV